MTGAAPLTQREVAERLGISRSYVSRIETRALERLRQEFGDT
jgi:RNA polymerase sporulation-specific sigma factor